MNSRQYIHIMIIENVSNLGDIHICSKTGIGHAMNVIVCSCVLGQEWVHQIDFGM